MELSALLTGFRAFQLQGTGMAKMYMTTVEEITGPEVVKELLQAYRAVEEVEEPLAQKKKLRADILSDEKLGPVARNIIKLWYVGTWYQLPAEWRENFGVSESDVTFVVSENSYTEGLLWPAVGAHPPGAKAPGYGTWGGPPEIPAF